MSKQFKTNDIIKNKNEALSKLNALLESLINDSVERHSKKANLISYWIKEYASYIENEETFSSNKLLRYKRGSVLRVNMGFNIGKEFGGLHYAVVIDNDNKRNADVITVIPLSSTDGKTVHERNVDLGMELYEKVSARNRQLSDNAQKEFAEVNSMYDTINSFIEYMDAEKDLESGERLFNTFKQKAAELQSKIDYLNKKIDIIKSNFNELSRMKYGSMAIINQIRTISKQRIYSPKKSVDLLYNISLSPAAMDKITSKLKELFIF